MRPTQHASHSTSIPSSCPSCGHDVAVLPSQAQARIQDLEAQVKLLNSKAAAAVDKLADYEDEVRYLRTQNTRLQTTTPDGAGVVGAQLATVGRLSSLSSLLGRRRNPSGNTNEITPTTPANPKAGFGLQSNSSTPALLPGVFPSQRDFSSPPRPATATAAGTNHGAAGELTLQSLQNRLESERQLRLRAESSLTQTQLELEELTAQLFGQANEMVATERRERKRLEDRVGVLETREKEKEGRWRVLEERVGRVERVRGLLEVKSVGRARGV